jgi:hypothetical protein
MPVAWLSIVAGAGCACRYDYEALDSAATVGGAGGWSNSNTTGGYVSSGGAIASGLGGSSASGASSSGGAAFGGSAAGDSAVSGGMTSMAAGGSGGAAASGGATSVGNSVAGGAMATGGATAAASGGTTSIGAGGSVTGGTAGAGGSTYGAGGATSVGGSVTGGAVATGGATAAASGGTTSIGAGGSVAGGTAGAGGSTYGGAGGTGAAGASSVTCSSPISTCVCESYAGHEYLFCSNTVSQSDARTACQAVGMDLVRIDSDAENTWISNSCTTYGLLKKANNYVFLGASDAALEGTWQWPDGTVFWIGDSTGSAVGGLYSDWRASNPVISTALNCAMMRLGGTWENRDCAGPVFWMCKSL